MDRALLDTDVFSELMRDMNSLVRMRLTSYLSEHGRLTISTLTVLEVVKGLIKSGRGARVQSFLQSVSAHDVLNLDV